jgi:hypothetical protein
MTSTKQTGRIQGALAGLLLVGLVVGIPTALLLGGGSPIPDQIPNTQDKRKPAPFRVERRVVWLRL